MMLSRSFSFILLMILMNWLILLGMEVNYMTKYHFYLFYLCSCYTFFIIGSYCCSCSPLERDVHM